MRPWTRNLLRALAGDPAPTGPDRRDAELEATRRQLAEAQAQIAELGEEIRELIATVGQRTIERDALADELEYTKAQLDAAHRALAGESPRYVDRAMETPPPPTSDRAAYLREKARADALARHLAETEAELHAIRYPRVPATTTREAS